MKKLILFAAVIGLSFTTAQAQEITRKNAKVKVEQRVTKETEMFKEELSLDEKQEVLVKKKVQEFAIKRHDLINSGLPKPKLQEQMKHLEAKKMEEMRSILNKEQFDHLMKIKEMRQDRMSNKRGKSNRLRSK